MATRMDVRIQSVEASQSYRLRLGFSLKPDGTIDEMKMLPVSPLTDFSFDFQDLLFTPVPSGK